MRYLYVSYLLNYFACKVLNHQVSLRLIVKEGKMSVGRT
jgi:hypothetical protein